jgi:hypothetical protein
VACFPVNQLLRHFKLFHDTIQKKFSIVSMAKNTETSLPRMLESVASGWDGVWTNANHQALGAGLVAALCLPALLLTLFQGLSSSKKSSKMSDSSSIRSSSEMSTLPWTLVAGLGVGLLTVTLRVWTGKDGTDVVSWVRKLLFGTF